ncbi:uncharacterized protein [Lepeophtheirus salmonis]|uniref:uncharacterized protein n=1 Tax=Lepeophtheirus salmonis TaxID=72036 RepID=UPI001AE73435|nr:uncharacterized protein LOC121132429 [Lepeophtheirus salmonis]
MMMPFGKLPLVVIVCFIGYISWVRGECQIESQPCDFPFTYEGKKFSYCTEHNATEGKFVCVSSHGEDRWSWGICNEGCLDEEDGSPLDFGGETMGQAVDCKNEPLSCVFPFIYNGVEHNECTEEDADFFWCATHVDEHGILIDNMWGKCDVASCTEDPSTESPEGVDPETEEEGPKNAKVLIDVNEIIVDLTFHQDDSESQLNIYGTISGLEPGLHGLAIHAENSDNCSNVGPHFNPLETTHGSHSSEDRHAGDLGNVEVDENGLGEINITLPIETTLFGPDSVLGKALVIYSEEDTFETEELLLTPLACGVIYEEDEWPLILILIIALSVAIVLLLILITILICCCMRRKKPKKKKALDKIPEDEILPLHNGNGSYNKKTPLYDELSIPFIDATPAPTPKLGRSIDRLSSFFTRNPSVGRSRGSLASIPAPTYPPPEVPANDTPWKGSRRLRRK